MHGADEEVKEVAVEDVQAAVGTDERGAIGSCARFYKRSEFCGMLPHGRKALWLKPGDGQYLHHVIRRDRPVSCKACLGILLWDPVSEEHILRRGDPKAQTEKLLVARVESL